MNMDFFNKSLTTALIISTVFLVINQIDIYLEKRYITGYRKNFLKAPIHFVLVFVVSMTFLYLSSHLFQLKKN